MASHSPSIVQELIELDHSLEAYRDRLEKNVAAFLRAKPNTRFSSAFKARLLRDLRGRLPLGAPSTSFSLFTMMNKLLYAGGGAVLGAFIAVVAVQNMPEFAPVPAPLQKEEADNAMRMMDEGQGMMDTAMQMPEGTPPAMPVPAGNPTISARPQSGGGGAGGGMAYGEMETMGSDAKMIAPYPEYQPTAVDFIYKGDVALPKSDVVVLERVTPGMSEQGDLLRGTFVSDLFNIAKVPGLKVQSVNLVQDAKQPYFVNVDFQNGSVSINKNIDYSARPESRCTDEACFARYRIKLSDMPSDSSAIAMADTFMKEFGIDTSELAPGVVQDDWRYWYEMTEDKANYWFPEQITVVYAYVMDGKPVYDEWGNAIGVNVTVDLREKGVTGVWGLQTMQYSKKSYPAAKSMDTMQKVIRDGGRNVYRDPSSKIFEAALKDPVEGYVQIYIWHQNTATSEVLYIPALVFPVDSIPMEANMVKKNVVVPLTEEHLQIDDSMMPRPMPLEEGAAG